MLDPAALRDLRQLAGDITFLQEARPPAELASAFPGDAHVAFTPGFRLLGETTGVATVSLTRPGVSCRLSHREPWLGTPKAIAVTRHAVANGTQLLAVNIHGVNISVGTRVFAEQLAALEPVLAAHNGPVVLGGDVNAWSHPRQRLLHALADRHGLKAIAFVPDLRTRFTDLPMDYLYQRGLRVLEARALPVSTSDHNPLRLRLSAGRGAEASRADRAPPTGYHYPP